MKFKKGSKVEVLSRKEVAIGAWLSAEIVSGNGHTYSVKYGQFPMTNEMMVERVTRKAIRPCPPPVKGPDWVAGDLVEVFHNLSWKIATVVEVMAGQNFKVRLFGFSCKLRVHRSHLRVRQTWQNGKWFVMGKGGENYAMAKRQTDARPILRVGDNCCVVRKNSEQKPQMILSRKLKRVLPSESSDVKTHGAARKRRTIQKNSSYYPLLQEHPSPYVEKVDAFVSPQEKMGEYYMHSSFHIGKTRCFDMDTFVDADSCSSSVGSCSTTGSNFLSHCETNCKRNVEHFCSDAMSFCGREDEEEVCSLSRNVDLGADVHRLELHTYQSAIRTLYASGPLSWEEEENISNLRHDLHISDDEHLREVRILIHADNRTPISTC